MQVAALPDRSRNLKLRPSTINRDRVGRVSLQLDRVCARFFCSFNDLYGLLVLLVMIGRDLGDDVGRFVLSNHTTPDSDLRAHSPPIGRIERTSSKASAAQNPATLPQRAAIARSACGDRGCGNSRASL